MNKKLVIWIKIGFFSLFLVIIDQLSKYYANIYLKGKNPIVLIKNILNLQYLDGGNTGAAWGIFSGNPIIFIVFTIFALIFLVIFLKNTIDLIGNKIHGVLGIIISFTLLISGAIGNFIDRIFYGYVTDFICFKFIDFPIFNIADCYVTISCVLLVIIFVFRIKEDTFNKIFSLKRNK